MQVVADRTMTWGDRRLRQPRRARRPDAPATTWYLAEGATHGGFDLFYLIQNPNAPDGAGRGDVPAARPGAPLVAHLHGAPHSRFNIWVDDEGAPTGLRGDRRVSAIVESTNGVPIIVERAMYLTAPAAGFGAGHESAGVTAPPTQWFLAEGATGDFFDLFILIANPQRRRPPTVQADYLLPTGRSITQTHTVAANSRFNIWVDLDDPALADAAVSTTHHLDQRRADRRRARDVVAGPDAATGTRRTTARARRRRGRAGRWPTGKSAGPRHETYILIANTSAFAGTARVRRCCSRTAGRR